MGMNFHIYSMAWYIDARSAAQDSSLAVFKQSLHSSFDVADPREASSFAPEDDDEEEEEEQEHAAAEDKAESDEAAQLERQTTPAPAPAPDYSVAEQAASERVAAAASESFYQQVATGGSYDRSLVV